MEQNAAPKADWKPLNSLIEEGSFDREQLLKTPGRISTGFDEMDELLGGGLSPGLVILGGSPSLGKSTFALTLARNVSESGTPVLYYSYEMPKRWLIAKLLTCESRRQGEPVFSADNLFNPDVMEAWTEETWSHVEAARESVAKQIRNLIVVDPVPGKDLISAKKLTEEVRDFIRERKQKPLVVVDYLQILPSESDFGGNARLQVEDHLRRLVALSKEEELTVLLISSLSRSNYKSPMQIDSFKETGSIEYSADVLMGIQFSACHDAEGNPASERAWNFNAEKEKEPREVELVFLKQRYGRLGTVLLDYDARYDFFEASDPQVRAQRAAGKRAEAEAEKRERLQPPDQPEEPKPQPERPVQAVPPLEEEPEELTLEEEVELLLSSGEIEEFYTQLAEEKAMEKRLKHSSKCCMNNTRIAHQLRLGRAVANQVNSCEVLPEIRTDYRVSARPEILDCAVADALYSLFVTYQYFSADHGFTLRQLLTALTGDGSQTLTAQKREMLRASLERLRGLQISIDCRAEREARGGKRKYWQFPFEEAHPFLTLAEENDRYYFPSSNLAEVLPLQAYGEFTSQIITFPPRLLNACQPDGRKALSDTAETIALKRFLIYRLEILRNPKGGKQRVIAFGAGSELFQALGLRREDFSSEALWKQRSQRLEKNLKLVLDYFYRICYIRDYVLTPGKRVEIRGPVSDPWEIGL